MVNMPDIQISQQAMHSQNNQWGKGGYKQDVIRFFAKIRRWSRFLNSFEGVEVYEQDSNSLYTMSLI